MRKKIILVTIIIVLLLSACGKQNIEESGKLTSKDETSVDNEISWMIKETELPDANEALADCIPEGGSCLEEISGMVEDTIYRVVMLRDQDLGNQGICIQKLESPYQKWENYTILRDEWVEDRYCYTLKETIGQDGSIHLLLQGIDIENNWYFYKAEWTENDGLYVQEIPVEYCNDEFLQSIKEFYVDKENSVYIVNGDGIQCFNEDFTKKAEWINSGYIWQIAENFLCGSSLEGTFRIWNLNSSNPLFSTDDVWMNFTDKVTFVNETEGILCNTDGIWQFSVEDGQIRQMMSFYDQGYSVEKICGVTVREDGTILMAVMIDGQYMLLERVEDTNRKDKVQLEFATWYATPFIREAVVDFNKQSEDCYIILREAEDGENKNDFTTRIQAEISTGAGPALLDDTVIDLKNAAEQGFLRNLTEDFGGQRDEILEHVWATGEVDGNLYAIPYSFSVYTLVASTDVVGEMDSWSAEEMMQYAKTEGVEAAVSTYGGSTLFYIMTMRGQVNEKLIDLEQGKSYFDSEEAISILEFSKQYSDTGTWEDWAIRITEEKVLSSVTSIWGLSTAQDIQAIFQGKEAYIGFPVEDGKSGNILFGNTISVNQACEYPEQANSFIRYLINEENQEQLGKIACNKTQTGGFPVSVKALDNMFLYAEEEQQKNVYLHNLASSGGVEYTLEPLTEEGLEKLRNLLLNARPVEENTGQISDIIAEEAQGFFSNDKTAQEVCDILQNRIQLYLDEM